MGGGGWGPVLKTLGLSGLPDLSMLELGWEWGCPRSQGEAPRAQEEPRPATDSPSGQGLRLGLGAVLLAVGLLACHTPLGGVVNM